MSKRPSEDEAPEAKRIADSEPTHESVVELREVTRDTARAVCNLAVGESQNNFVQPNSFSIANAYFEPKAWFRAIHADDTPVGFVMLFVDEESAKYDLWRFMVDARYQKMGFGNKALEQTIAHVKTRPKATEMRLTYMPGEGSPSRFYEKAGFKHTGVDYDGELEMKLVFA